MRRVIVLVIDGVQTLDVAGPAEVFAGARRDGAPYYQVEFVSVGGGERITSSGLCIRTKDAARLRLRADDTLLVGGAGEEHIVSALADAALTRWLARAGRAVQRVTSVCSGAFLLANAGLLDGKRAATHWLGCEQLAKAFPKVVVDANAIYVRDGDVWTSAGVTTGIDMALAIVEHDLDRATADALAAMLVLYARRPGFQSQFSQAMVAQTSASDPLGPALHWARANLEQADIESLARHAGMSVRTLHRRCLEQLGTTPAKLIDKLRIEHARNLLATSTLPSKTLAAQCGFKNAARMQRAFQRELGIGPRDYRLLHAQ
jgi:transcriptional regulator GlxA family with amidase domain